MAEYRSLLNQTTGQGSPSQQSSFQSPPNPEQVRGSLADCLGTAAEAAKSAAINRDQAHQIVEQAYQRQSW